MGKRRRYPTTLTLLAAALLSASAASGDETRNHRPEAHGHHGRHGGKQGMAHRFRKASHWAKRFDNPKRARWQRPDAVVRALKLQPTMRVADIGSGTGYFAVRFARAVPGGRVYGIDVEPDMVRYLNRRAKKARLKHLSSHRGAAGDPKLPEPVDVIFLCNTYHHLPRRVAYFRRLLGKLRPGGRLVIVDFKQGKIPVGPAERHRISPEHLHRELTSAGYRRTRLDDKTLPYQYIAIYGRERERD